MKFVKIIAVCLSLILVFVTAGILYKLLSERENTDSQESTHTNDASTTSDDSSGEDETSPTLSKADYGVEIGDLAYDFTLENYDGDEVSLSDYLGQVVVVNFFATWCGPCTSELPEFSRQIIDVTSIDPVTGEVRHDYSSDFYNQFSFVMQIGSPFGIVEWLVIFEQSRLRL